MSIYKLLRILILLSLSNITFAQPGNLNQHQFQSIDADANDLITLDEFRQWNIRQIDQRFGTMDKDRDGAISFEEFKNSGSRAMREKSRNRKALINTPLK